MTPSRPSDHHEFTTPLSTTTIRQYPQCDTTANRLDSTIVLNTKFSSIVRHHHDTTSTPLRIRTRPLSTRDYETNDTTTARHHRRHHHNSTTYNSLQHGHEYDTITSSRHHYHSTALRDYNTNRSIRTIRHR